MSLSTSSDLGAYDLVSEIAGSSKDGSEITHPILRILLPPGLHRIRSESTAPLLIGEAPWGSYLQSGSQGRVTSLIC